MLTYEDAPTIRNAILKRLGKEPGVAIADIYIAEAGDKAIQVGIWLIRTDVPTEDGLLDTKSTFELPPTFEHKALLNQIDEVAEQSKIAKKQYGVGKILWTPEAERNRHSVLGTGLRGAWKRSSELGKSN